MNLDPVRLRILKLMKERRTDLKNASVAIGRNAAYLHQFVYRGTPKILTQEVREALAKELGCNAEELRHRRVPPRKPRSQPQSVEQRIRSIPGGQIPEGHARIAEIDVRASAGPGAINEGLEEVKHVWFFPENVIRHELRARTDDLRMITIDGDSMEPLLGSGDRIVIDTSQRVPAPPGIFVIWDGMGLVAKRIEHEPNSDPSVVKISSVNPQYETYDRGADEVHIVGRVIWTARRL